MKLLMLTICLLCAPFCTALESRDLSGLDIQLEPITEPVMVDGVQMHIRRATGPDVQQLAMRITARWRSEGSPVQQREHAGWQIVVRLDGSRNEVIQWRTGTSESQLLHSIVDVRQQTQSPSPEPFRLPSPCRWGRSIEGVAARTIYQQRTAICRAGARTVMARLRTQLSEQGWMVRANAASMLQLSRAGREADVFVIQAPAGDHSIVVWVAAAATGTPPR